MTQEGELHSSPSRSGRLVPLLHRPVGWNFHEGKPSIFLRPVGWLSDPYSGEVLHLDTLFERR